MRVGVLTGGGDCPGLNAVIRAVVRKGVKVHDIEFIGYRDGWKGPLEGVTMELGVPEVRGILPRGGTILGSSRTNPFKIDGGVEQIKVNLARDGVDALVAIGGEDTLGVATKLSDLGVNVVGVPKTIDNDLSGTDFTFGFDTAVNIATEAIDRLHTTAESHHRVLVVEVMGRHAGWIALHSGIAGGANIVLIPEMPFDIDEVCRLVESRFESRFSPILVVSEGAVPRHTEDPTDVEGMTLLNQERDAFGHVRLGGIGDRLAGRDRGAHRQGGPGGGPRPHPARWHPHGVRPLAGDPLRAPGHRRGRRGRLRDDDGAARHRHRPGPAHRGDRRAQARLREGVRRGAGLLRLTAGASGPGMPHRGERRERVRACTLATGSRRSRHRAEHVQSAA